MEKQPSRTLNLTGALADPTRIILVSYTHYLALSLFFFPLCATITSLILAILNVNLMKELPNSNLDQKTVLYLIIYIIFVYTITQCGIATITYSTHHRVLGNPASLLTVLKSLKCTFFQIFFTSFVAGMLVVLVTLPLLLIYVLVLTLGQNLGSVSSYDYFLWFLLVPSVMLAVILSAILCIVIVKWSLAYVVVVAESKWGFSALKRSWHLCDDEGMKSLTNWSKLKGIYIFCGSAVLVAVVYYLILSFHLTISELSFILLTVFGSFFLMMVMLKKTVDDSVFYNYLKAFHDELAVKIDEGYVNPSADVKKVPHAVNVAAA